MSDSSNPANLGKPLETAHSSAAEEYYRYKLLEEKLKGTGNEAILKKRSEKDQIEMFILKKVFEVNESSPEFEQLVSITGSRDRFVQAQHIAKLQHDKLYAEFVLGRYGATKAEVNQVFDNSNTSALTLRGVGGAAAAATTSAMAGSLLRSAGLSSGSGAPGSIVP